MRFKIVFGWLLVAIGLLIILWIIFYSYQILTFKKDIPLIFKETDIKNSGLVINIDDKYKNQDVQKQLEKLVSDKLDQIISPQIILKIFNLLALSIFAGIFIFGGSKIAFIGIELLKNNKDNFKF
jgi:hypothetical protein